MAKYKHQGKWGDLFDKPQTKKAELFIDSFDDFLYEVKNKKPSKGVKASAKNPIFWHPSQLGNDSSCVRRLAYQYTNTYFDWVVAAFSSQTLRVFDNGTYVHSRLQNTIAEMHQWSGGKISLVGKWKCGCGHVVGGDARSKWKPRPKKCSKCGRAHKWDYREISLLDKSHCIVGRTDGVILWKNQEWLLEIKSMSPFLFPKLMEPPEGYLAQANLYMYLTGIKQMLFIVECKGTQSLKEFHIKYDPTIAKPILRKLEEAKKAVGAKKWPAAFKLDSDIKDNCRKCAYREPCTLNLPFAWNISEEDITKASGKN